MSTITYHIATPQDKGAILDLYPDTFGRHEPLHACLGHMERAPFFPLYLDYILPQAVSYVAIDEESRELAGFALNEVVLPDGEDKLELALRKSSVLCTPQTKRSTEIISAYLDELHSKFKEKFSKNKVFHITIGAVHTSYQKRGIHYQFAKLREKSASDSDCDVIVVEATSCFSQRNYEKLNYECINYIPYDGFLYKGDRVFLTKVMGPHVGGKSMFKCLT